MKNRLNRLSKKAKSVQKKSDRAIIEIVGNEKVIVEDVKNIIEYENERVRVSTGNTEIKITGLGLSIDGYENNVVVVYGFIKGVCLE